VTPVDEGICSMIKYDDTGQGHDECWRDRYLRQGAIGLGGLWTRWSGTWRETLIVFTMAVNA
jgi:hypothetical protein